MDAMYQSIGSAKHTDSPMEHSDFVPTAPVEESEEKVCRICLEEDQPETMIAPCRCKGGSKWVHRECLDLWRTNQRDRAFSQCTECLFRYHLQPPAYESPTHRRKMKFCWLVSRDLCGITILLQLVVAGLGAAVWALDPQQQLLRLFCATSQCQNGDWHDKGIYYVSGFLLLLVLLGVFGCAVLCSNRCSIRDSIPASLDDVRGNEPTITAAGNVILPSPVRAPSEFEREMYRTHRRRQTRGYRYRRDDCCDACIACNQPVYVYNTGSGDCCCCCCCPDASNVGCCLESSSGDCCGGAECCDIDGSSSSGSGGGSGDGAMHIFIVIIVAVAIVMAVIGFVVGIIIAVIIFQRTLQTHMHLVQKRQLVREFAVMDLSGYDLDGPLPSAPMADEDIELQAPRDHGHHPVPSAPTLHDEDEIYLQKMGLLSPVDG